MYLIAFTIWDMVSNIVGFLADFLTIVASGIAIYIFWAKRNTISSAFKALLNYMFRVTLSELNGKLDKLNELSADDPEQKGDVVNILNDIVGQIRGNQTLKTQYADLLSRLEKYAELPGKLTEPKKRSLVSELREGLKHVDVQNFDQLIGG